MTVTIPLLLVLPLTLGGCGAIGNALMFTGMTISCGPMPMSADQCNGGWLKSLTRPSKNSEEEKP